MRTRFAILVLAAAVQAVPGVRCRILLERVDHSRVTVPLVDEFHLGDRIRLRIGLKEPAYVCVLGRTVADFRLEPSALRSEGPSHATDSSPGIKELYVVVASHLPEGNGVLNVSGQQEGASIIEITLRHLS